MKDIPIPFWLKCRIVADITKANLGCTTSHLENKIIEGDRRERGSKNAIFALSSHHLRTRPVIALKRPNAQWHTSTLEGNFALRSPPVAFIRSRIGSG